MLTEVGRVDIVALFLSLFILSTSPTECISKDISYLLFLPLGWCFQLSLLMAIIPTADIIESLPHNSGISTNTTELSSNIYRAFSGSPTHREAPFSMFPHSSSQRPALWQ